MGHATVTASAIANHTAISVKRPTANVRPLDFLSEFMARDLSGLFTPTTHNRQRQGFANG